MLFSSAQTFFNYQCKWGRHDAQHQITWDQRPAAVMDGWREGDQLIFHPPSTHSDNQKQKRRCLKREGETQNSQYHLQNMFCQQVNLSICFLPGLSVTPDTEHELSISLRSNFRDEQPNQFHLFKFNLPDEKHILKWTLFFQVMSWRPFWGSIQTAGNSVFWGNSGGKTLNKNIKMAAKIVKNPEMLSSSTAGAQLFNTGLKKKKTEKK